MSVPAEVDEATARPEPYGSPQLEHAARVCFLSAAALGLLALCGTLLGMRVDFAPGLTDIRQGAAACLVLLGSALWLRRRRGRLRRVREALAFAAIAATLGITSLSLHDTIRTLRLGVEQYLGTPSVMSGITPFSALNLLLLALATAIIHVRGRALVLSLTALPLLLSLSSLVGYLYGGDPLRSTRTLPPMVALTAVGVAALAVGVICTRLKPETGTLLSARDGAGRAMRRLLLGLVTIPIALGGAELALRPLDVYEVELGTALLVVGNVLLLVSLSIWHTHEVQRGLRRQAQLERELAHKEAELAADLRMREERARGQHALARSEEKFRTLAVHAPVAIFESTPEGECTFVNRRWSELTERTLEEARGFGWALAVHPDDRERVAHIWSAAMKQGAPLVAEFRFLAPSGKVSWVHSRAVPVRDASGAITGYLGTLVDVTERKQTMDALAKSERSFRSLVERAPFGVVVFRDSVIAYANAAYLKMLGYDDPSELVGKPLPELVTDPSRAAVIERMQHLEEDDHPHLAPLAVPCRRKDGSEVLLEGTSSNIVFDGADAVVAVARDVTEQQRVEHVRMLAERALRESLREKEMLLKEIHHRVKNNLQVIVSLINLQASKLDDEVTRAAFAETRARVHAIALLHERLYRSKNLGRIDMRDYLHGLASDLRSTAQLRHIETRVVAEEVYWEMDSAVPIGLIVNELVTNAYKHAFPDRKAGRIDIELGRHGTECIVTVSDDGVGFPEGFESHDSLGLLLITSLSRQLGGGVTFESQQGARAVVRFPDPSRDAARGGELRTA